MACNPTRFLFLSVMALATPLSLAAMDYHLSADGDDTTGDGSAGAPWASLAKVNAVDLEPGDRVLLRAGDRFAGGLELRSADRGTAAEPIIITSLGDGRAIIEPVTGEHGIDCYNTAGIEISNLIIDGSDPLAHDAAGIQAYCDLDGDDARLPHLRITGCEIRNVHTGISIAAWGANNTYSGFEDVLISDCFVHDIADEGIRSYGMYPGSATRQSHRNIVVRDCEVTRVSGDPAKTTGHSGSGIVLSGTIGGLIEGCYAHHNGGSGGRTSGGGPVGIWCWDAVDVTIRRCLVHDQRTIDGAVDGGGFDFDGGAVNCTIEYSYSWGNEGPGFLVAEFRGAPPLTGNTVRYSISYDDGQANRMGGIHFWNGKSDPSLMEHTTFHNNLIVAGPNTTGPVVDHQSGGVQGMRFHNNIFVTRNGRDLVKINSQTAGFTFQGNLWHAIDGNHDYRWDGTTYDSLSAWRAASGNPETLDGTNTGLETDPGLVELDNMPRPTSIAELDAVIACRLAAGSAAVDAGLDLQAHFAIDAGGRDFWGNAVPQGSAPDIGPHERAPVDAEAPTTPTDLQSSNPTSSSCRLSWSPSSDNVAVTAYTLWRDGVVADTTSLTSLVVTGLAAETTYSFAVQAHDAAGNTSPLSTSLMVTTLADAATRSIAMAQLSGAVWQADSATADEPAADPVVFGGLDPASDHRLMPLGTASN